ncbi:MAG: GspE/PulE family protein [Phycisphaerales bacterium]|jgi:general secretion pathway protein E/type IV pilus assembly protein PilB|nr:GspE/PulE family protein [Phycisphaerales bacterium]MDP6889950.1 GspE/PulE family protein [Phycisphaerales bacterium]
MDRDPTQFDHDTGEATEETLTANRTIDEEAAAIRSRADLLGLAWHERPVEVDSATIELVEPEVAVRLRIVPIMRRGHSLVLAMFDPLDTEAADEIAVLTGLPVEREGMDPGIFAELLRKHYGTTASKMADLLGGQTESDGDELEHNLDAFETDDIHRMAEEPTLVNLVNLILIEAIQSRTSDVHVEPFENELTVRYRIDGVLHMQPPPPKHLQPALIGRIKIMAGMNIAERYVPQDGKISLRYEGRKIDIRVSTVPTLYGESVVMRILDKSQLRLDFDTLGIRPELQSAMDSLLAKPHGILLNTGPTGSGKTTTLYASLTRIFDPTKKIITIEDPVEYELPGINQMPVNAKRGLTFASGLRSILRQDPDIVLVGEIRDGETADIAIRSALTGHLILSTLHTNDAISSIGRLVDMGAEPYLVASVLEGLLAQRLGRRICEHCRTQVPMPEDIAARLPDAEAKTFGGKVWIGAGCEKCSGSGYRGRVGFFELIRITGDLRRAIAGGAVNTGIAECLPRSFRTMREDGMDRAREGVTTVPEVLRATQDAEETYE